MIRWEKLRLDGHEKWGGRRPRPNGGRGTRQQAGTPPEARPKPAGGETPTGGAKPPTGKTKKRQKKTPTKRPNRNTNTKRKKINSARSAIRSAALAAERQAQQLPPAWNAGIQEHNARNTHRRLSGGAPSATASTGVARASLCLVCYVLEKIGETF